MDIPPEFLEVIGRRTGPKCSSFRFLVVVVFFFLQIRFSEPSCTTVVWPMMIEALDGMFSGKSVYAGT